MRIRYADVENVLQRARLYYKGKLKSCNKVYFGAINYRTGRRDSKRARRNFEAAIAGEQLEILRDIDFETDLRAEKGQILFGHDITVGNCGEMACVVAFLCTRRLAWKCARIRAACPQAENDGPDHMFVLLQDRDAPDHDFKTIVDMAEHPVEGYWVIDCWMNIACRAEAYLTFARMKAAKWALERKMVLTVEERDFTPTPVHMTATRFIDIVSRAEIEWFE